jgi:AcrR family transcriptional regulator
MARDFSRNGDRTEIKPLDLTPAQSLAVAALAGGATKTAAAEAAGVSRPTLYHWFDYETAFIVELNRARAERSQAIRTELQNLATDAVRALRELLGVGTPPAVRLRAALAVLAAAPDYYSPTDAIDIEDAIERREHEREQARRSRKRERMTDFERLVDDITANS